MKKCAEKLVIKVEKSAIVMYNIFCIFVRFFKPRKVRSLNMADNKKMVEAITSMDEDFAKWYTDIVKKAELIEYTSVKGCMVIRPYGYAIWEHIQSILDGMF